MEFGQLKVCNILCDTGRERGRAAASLTHSIKLSILFYSMNNQQMQLYAVNCIPLLGSLYMFRVSYTPIIRSTIFNCIYSHWYKP